MVHGDLSEYNMLYHSGVLYIIDVSQSVEGDHPQSLDFLKRDCVNVNNFFGRCMEGNPIGVQKLFDFVVTKELPAAVTEGSDEGVVKKLLAEALERSEEDADDAVFMQTWIPSHLDQVNDRAFIERDIARKNCGEELLYDRLLADRALEDERADESSENEDPSAPEQHCSNAVSGKSGAREDPNAGRPTSKVEEDDASGDDGTDSDGDRVSADGENQKAERDGHIPEGMDKRQWKAQVKAERAEKRKEKCPKALKKKFRKEAAKGR